LALDYECPNGLVSDATLDVAIRDKEGTLFQGTNEAFGRSFGRLHRRGRLAVRFETMPANGAEIQFFVTILNGRTAEVYDWKRHITLRIEKNPKLLGRIAVPVDWTHSTPEQ
jgi:hypothetical protein